MKKKIIQHWDSHALTKWRFRENGKKSNWHYEFFSGLPRVTTKTMTMTTTGKCQAKEFRGIRNDFPAAFCVFFLSFCLLFKWKWAQNFFFFYAKVGKVRKSEEMRLSFLTFLSFLCVNVPFLSSYFGRENCATKSLLKDKFSLFVTWAI